jgi:ribosomal protein S18 acetylase RimI-like enzyme
VDIRSATLNDVDAIVKLHCQAFPEFFLTLLGESFLQNLYQSFCTHPSGVLIVACESGQVLGFAAGTVSPDVFFSEVRKARWAKFLVAALPAAIRHPIIVSGKLFSALFYRGERPVELPGAALLSSIGVDPNIIGRSIGSGLLHEFEVRMKAQLANAVYLTTDGSNNERANNFYRKCGYSPESHYYQRRKRLMVRYVKNLRTNPKLTEN